MQREWLGEWEGLRARRPDLDRAPTHVDDRFDAGMRDAIGADAARFLQMLDSHAFPFLIEDPGDGLESGAQRDQAIAEKLPAADAASRAAGGGYQYRRPASRRVSDKTADGDGIVRAGA
jgi:hypothetical protein